MCSPDRNKFSGNDTGHNLLLPPSYVLRPIDIVGYKNCKALINISPGKISLLPILKHDPWGRATCLIKIRRLIFIDASIKVSTDPVLPVKVRGSLLGLCIPDKDYRLLLKQVKNQDYYRKLKKIKN